MKLCTSLLLLGLVSMLSFVASVRVPSNEGKSYGWVFTFSLRSRVFNCVDFCLDHVAKFTISGSCVNLEVLRSINWFAFSSSLTTVYIHNNEALALFFFYNIFWVVEFVFCSQFWHLKHSKKLFMKIHIWLCPIGILWIQILVTGTVFLALHCEIMS